MCASHLVIPAEEEEVEEEEKEEERDGDEEEEKENDDNSEELAGMTMMVARMTRGTMVLRKLMKTIIILRTRGGRLR